MKRGFIKISILISILALVFSSCATGPETVTPPENITDTAPPDWVFNIPDNTNQYMFFVGSGSNNSGDFAEAEKVAADHIIKQIIQEFGVSVRAESTAETQATLDSFEASVRESVSQEGTANIAGFRIKEKWMQEEDGTINVYVLGEYSTSEFKKEKARIAKLEQEKEDAIAIPEAKGNEYMAAENYIEAAREFMVAAAAASVSELENAAIYFEENIQNTKSAVNKIALFKMNDNLETVVGDGFGQEFQLRVVSDDNIDGSGLANVPIRISYKEKKSNGRLTTKYISMYTDSDGIVSFNHPAPQFVGDETVTMRLDLSDYFEVLEGVSSKFADLVDELDTLIAKKKAVFQFSSISMAKEIPTGIVILDVDKARNPIGTSDVATGVLESLSKSDFDVRIIDYDSMLLQNASDKEIISAISSQFGGTIERLIFGIVGIDSFEEEDNGFTVKIAGTIKVVDLESGKILYSERKIKNSRGSNIDKAVSLGFVQIGENFGNAMVNDLP